MVISMYVFFFFKQKTADEMRISDWSSDVCSSDLASAADIDRIRISLGLDRPLLEQFFIWLSALLKGDLGRSIISNMPISRSEERRVGKECVSTCRFRWPPYH